MIRMLDKTYDVKEAVAQIDGAPSVWNRYTDRLAKTGPHREADDIWVRFNPIENMGPGFFTDPHESDWYEVASELPVVRSLAERVYADSEGSKLGGVLVTRIPAGKRVYPHVDSGWHAGHYEKIAVQLKGNADQSFNFDNCSLSPLQGQSYTFDNSKRHWVNNDSDSERMTLIVCIRK